MTTKESELVKALTRGLKIDNDIFAIETVREATESINEDKYMQFYKDVMKEDTYGNGMKAILKISEAYKKRDIAVLTQNSRQLAKEMYDKFYAENCVMTDYTQNNREKIANDRLWFESIDYSKLKRSDGTSTYTKQEIYVLNELGGGGWLLDIRFALNSNDVVDKIEKIINTTIVTKYEKNDNAIESKKVMKMLRGDV